MKTPIKDIVSTIQCMCSHTITLMKEIVKSKSHGNALMMRLNGK